jgi:hypothetical protein
MMPTCGLPTGACRTIGFRAGREEVDRALERHVLATAELIGTFRR